MSDETQMTPDLEKFAAQLSQSDLPAAKLDRDQLMYDAGWAAALAQQNSVPVNQPQSGFSRMVVSFASGLAVAATLFLCFLPANGDVFIPEDEIVAESEQPEQTSTVSQSMIATASQPVEQSDLLDWIENLPQGHVLGSGFSSKPGLTALARTDSDPHRSTNQLPQRHRTSQQIMQELIPSVRPKRSLPAWTTLLNNSL